MKINSETRRAVLNVLDYLYYHDFVFSLNFTQDREMQYWLILSAVDDINLAQGYDGEKAALYKHFLLCGFEIQGSMLCDVNNFGLLKNANELFEKVLCQVVDCEFLEVDFLKDLGFLIDKFKNINKYFTCKLVGFCLYYEYNAMSMGVLICLLSKDILKIKKYRGVFSEKLISSNKNGLNNGDSEKEIEKQSLDIFFRAMLFIEFEIIKNQIYIKDKMSLMDFGFNFKKDVKEMEDDILFATLLTKLKSLIDVSYKSISKQNFDFEIDFFDYIFNVVGRLGHQKIFFDDLKGCVGFISGLYIDYALEYSESDAIHQEPENENIYDVAKNTCADTARLIMKRYGFEFKTSRTIYSYYQNNESVCNWFRDCLNSRNTLIYPNYSIYSFKKKRGYFPFFNLFLD